ncbi:methyltransferase [Glaciecola petra]|uniref:Ribosomal RNA small subunit methyltransferase C n=1 Tax=Glaciecola petra TaxID=3075602 RepID=A0ABU2ZXE2_9ALTE|nr:methyltransferase [Aestuariibacter sp. P117]MDT0596092.1 methyltransferase [Aestuariibacter sp. P117]
MLSSSSQVLLRNKEHFEQGKWAFINPTEAFIFEQINNDNIVGLHQMYNDYESCLQQTKNKQVFAASFSLADIDDTGTSRLDGVVIYLPKAKQQLVMLIENAAALVKDNGSILIIGENKAGVKSVSKLLEKFGQHVNKIDSAKHCGLYALTLEKPLPDFNVDKYSEIRSYNIHDTSIKVFSLPGVFGHKQLDPGTDLLLSELSPTWLLKEAALKRSSHVYDFACGTGLIGVYVAKVMAVYFAAKFPKNSHTIETPDDESENIGNVLKISMSDVSALAIYCSQKTAQLNNIDTSFATLDIVPKDGMLKPIKSYNLIVSNPPFHAGIQNDYSITQNFIKASFSLCKPYAKMVLVANRFLPYPDALQQVYGKFQELNATPKYRVYQVEKSKK